MDRSLKDRAVLTVQDGFSDAFMSSDWPSTNIAAPVLEASRSDLQHPIVIQKPPKTSSATQSGVVHPSEHPRNHLFPGRRRCLGVV